MTYQAVEIRNQLTMELITILRPTEIIFNLKGPPAYSPDGSFIACASSGVITIWDIQTGGVAKEIKCGFNTRSLVWSLDGRTICTIHSGPVTFTVHMYDVSSGTASSPSKLQSGDKPCLWTDNESFKVMTAVPNGDKRYTVTIHILKAGSTPTMIESFILSVQAEVGSALTEVESIVSPPGGTTQIGSFSPTTYHISISDRYTLRIFHIRNSRTLLDQTGDFPSHCFSSDGSLFAASHNGGVRVWKYASGKYTPWRVYRCQDLSSYRLQFSPTLSSMLGHSRDILQVWRLLEPPLDSEIRQKYVGLSRSGTCIATARKLKKTVEIADLLDLTPPQYIDTDVEIDGLVITGNVLLVAGSRKLTAWLLTEEGLVDGVTGYRRVGRSDSIWTVPYLEPGLRKFQVEGQVGVVKLGEYPDHIYHTETGEVLDPNRASEYLSGSWDNLGAGVRGRDYLRYHNLSQRNTPSEDCWQISRDTLQEGWIKDPEGKRRLWVPVEWRMEWDPEDWCHDVTTQFSILGGRTVLIKF